MTNTTNNNKAFWVFPNMKESVDSLPPRLRGQAWELIINYAFGDDNCERNCKNNRVSFVFRALKPLIRLRGIAGSQNGKSNNPSGLSKTKQPNIGPNIGPNIAPNPLITETETKTETKETNKEKDAGATNSLFDRFVNRWNNGIAKNYDVPEIMVLSDQRRSKLKSRMKQAAKLYPDLDEVEAIFKIIADAFGGSRFLRGELQNNNFKFSLDFVLQEQSFIKMYEGFYNDKN